MFDQSEILISCLNILMWVKECLPLHHQLRVTGRAFRKAAPITRNWWCKGSRSLSISRYKGKPLCGKTPSFELHVAIAAAGKRTLFARCSFAGREQPIAPVPSSSSLPLYGSDGRTVLYIHHQYMPPSHHHDCRPQCSNFDYYMVQLWCAVHWAAYGNAKLISHAHKPVG